MKKYLLFLMVVLLVFPIIGCDNKYSGKIFNVRIETWDGKTIRVETWKNVTDMSYDSEKGSYTFYINGRMVEMELCDSDSILISEVGAEPSSVITIEPNK